MVSELDVKREFEELADTTKSDISAIIKSEVFSKLIIEEAEKGSKLKGVIAAKEEDLKKGDSDTVKVRIYPIIAVSASSEAAALSESAAYKPIASEVTLGRYGVSVPLTAESIFHASDNIVARVASAIGKGWRNLLDETIAGVLFGDYTPAVKKELAAAGDLADFYDKLKAVVDTMLYEQGKDPDYLICGKDIAEKLVLLYEDASYRNIIKVDGDGRIKSVYGLKVIVSAYAPAVDDTAGKVLAAVIDSSQALVEASGIPAKFVEKYEPEYDKYKEIFQAYWGVARVEADLDGDDTAEAIGIGLIVNPAA